MLENKEQRVKELQELYRQFIMDKLSVDVNNQLDTKISLDIPPNL